MEKKWADRWERGEKLSRGGQGQTYLAHPIDNPAEKVVLKIPHNRKDPQSRARLAREVLSLQELDASGAAVPAVRDTNSELWNSSTAELYIVTDFIEGDTLEHVVATRKSLPVEQAIDLTLKVAETVEIAHASGILHRDLKPNNLIVQGTAPAEVVVIDLGLSFFRGIDNVTEAGERLRNDFLHLPEYTDQGGNKQDPRSDIAAMCGLAYFMMTGHVPSVLRDSELRPPHRRKEFSLQQAIGDDPLLKPLERFFDRGFEYNPNDRFQNVEEFREALIRAGRRGGRTPDTDPRLYAAEVTSRLITNSPDFRRRTYRAPADAALDIVERVARQSDLGKFFRLAANKSRSSKEFQFPKGYLPVGANRLELVASADVLPQRVSGLFQAGARGERVVIFSTTRLMKPKERAMGRAFEPDLSQPAVLQELLSIDPAVGVEAFQIELEAEARRWVNGAVDALADLIQAASSDDDLE